MNKDLYIQKLEATVASFTRQLLMMEVVQEENVEVFKNQLLEKDKIIDQLSEENRDLVNQVMSLSFEIDKLECVEDPDFNNQADIFANVNIEDYKL